jgi:hypothetical protein
MAEKKETTEEEKEYKEEAGYSEGEEGATVDLGALDDMNTAFDEAEPASFESVPDGNYHARVESVILSTSKTSGKPMLKWNLIITKSAKDAEQLGRSLPRNNMLVPESFPFLKADMQNCGVTLNAPLSENLPKAQEELLDLILEVRVKANKDPDYPPNVYIKSKVGKWNPDDAEAAGETAF